MDTLESIQQQMKATEGQLGGYGADLPGEIESQVQKAATPLLQESLGVSRDLMGDYLGRYFDITQMGPGMAGTTAKDLSPTQKLGVMGRELGHMTGDLQRTQRYSDYLGGQMNDLYDKAIQAAQMGQQSLADQYNRLGQQQQMLWQQAEAEKDRALQRELAELAARSSGGGGGLVIDYGGAPEGSQLPPEDTSEPDITVEDSNWEQKFISKQTQPLSSTPTAQFLGIKTPDWVRASPFGTALTLGGNLIGNLNIPKRENMSFIDKLLNR
jgi:hypothetical protein